MRPWSGKWEHASAAEMPNARYAILSRMKYLSLTRCVKCRHVLSTDKLEMLGDSEERCVAPDTGRHNPPQAEPMLTPGTGGIATPRTPGTPGTDSSYDEDCLPGS